MKMTRCPHCHRSLRFDYSESISSLIQGLGITKTQFAEDLGTSRWLLHQWLNGSVNPGPDFLKKIKEVYDFVAEPRYTDEKGPRKHHEEAK